MLLNQYFLATNDVDATLWCIESLTLQVVYSSRSSIFSSHTIDSGRKVATKEEELEVVEDYPVAAHACRLAESETEGLTLGHVDCHLVAVSLWAECEAAVSAVH